MPASIVGVRAAEGRENRSGYQTTSGPERGSNPEGCGQRAIVRGRCKPASVPDRVRHFGPTHLIPWDRHRVPLGASRRGHASELFLYGRDPAERLFLAVVGREDARAAAVTVMMTSTLGRGVRIAPPRPAECREARSCRKRQRDGEQYRSKHGHPRHRRARRTPSASNNFRRHFVECRGATSDRHRESGTFSPQIPRAPAVCWAYRCCSDA